MLLRPGQDVALVRRALLESAASATLLLGLATVLMTEQVSVAAPVVFGWLLILFYWLARRNGRAGTIPAMLAVPPSFGATSMARLMGRLPALALLASFPPLAAVAVAFFAESRSAA